MRFALVPLLLLQLFGCAQAPEPEPEFDFEAAFRTPARYTVVSGDTLNRIAARHGVSAEDLKRWNGIDGHIIEVEQVLLIWEGGEPVPASRGRRSASRRTIASSARASVGSSLPDDWEAPAMVSTAGVLGVLGLGESELGQRDLQATLASTTTVASTYSGPSTSLAGRGNMSSGRAEQMSVSIERRLRPTAGSSGVQFGTSSVSAPRLPLPSRKRCLAGPSAASLGDYGAVASQGLDASQVKRSLKGIVRHTARCVPAGSSGAFSVTMELSVGCDGRVRSVDTVSGGGAPRKITSCIEKTLGYSGFPAHDMPDGFTFRYPIHFGR